jgi:hypothetical protein
LWNFELFEKTVGRRECQVDGDELKVRVDVLSAAEGGLDVAIVAAHFYELSASDLDGLGPSVFESIVGDPGLVLKNEDSLFEAILRQASRDLSFFSLLEFVRFEFLSESCVRTAIEFISANFDLITIGIWSSVGTRLALTATPSASRGRYHRPRLESEILSEFPDIFTVFAERQFRLLYRGSRDGFGRRTFHERCDGHSETVTVVQSENDCIFGGYTPLAWHSRGEWMSDPDKRGFLFTIKNPHSLSPRIFHQKEADYALFCGATYGPSFGTTADLRVWNGSESNQSCYTTLGRTYTNDTNISDQVVFTGARDFVLKEIEVFHVVSSK